MGLRDIGASLPPGFRFYPSDEELVCHYLQKKIGNEDITQGTLVEIDLHTCEPWQLPEVAKLNSSEWYFFSFRDRKYATGFRTNRATTSGYWKATGKDRTVVDPRTNGIVGMRKTLVFYKNRAPNGIKTGWIMHEFRLENPHIPPKEEWVLCRVFHKSKTENNIELSPQNVFDEEVTAGGADTSPGGAVQIIPPPAGSYNSKNHQTISSFIQAPPNLHHQSLLNPNHLQNFPLSNSTNLPLSHQFHMTDRLKYTTRKRENYDGVFEDYDELMINSRCVEDEDDYGFLLDNMNFEESNLGGGMSCSNMEDIKFEDDNGMIIL